ncbi:MAG: SDR family oxidoreductase [Sporomusaceae bacterium]|jgi:NAD(P)-dependent dehydrogenase (short-subunit alcohol dehydrogenase family)|nr:SDR family oxidoreductase [Sporomusaceae bacterium]
MLQGKKVFVSGGSGFIGAEICRACAEYGAAVYFSYYENEEAAEKLAAEIQGAQAIKLNLRDVADITAKIETLYQTVELMDVLVNNAGTSQIMPFSMLAEEDVDYLLDVNVKGTVFLTKAVIRRMIKHRKGTVVNLGSIAGHRMFDVPVHYAFSKAAISGFTMSLTAELKRYGIRVNSVVPGLIAGGIGQGIPPELQEKFTDHCAAGRPGTAREIAEVVCFLASERASYVNGQNIFVDGGI